MPRCLDKAPALWRFGQRQRGDDAEARCRRCLAAEEGAGLSAGEQSSRYVQGVAHSGAHSARHSVVRLPTRVDEVPASRLSVGAGFGSSRVSLQRRRADGLATREGVQDDHRVAAVRAHEGR